MLKKKNANVIGLGYAHTYNTSDFVFLNFIAVKKRYQRKGIGSEILKRILDRAVRARKRRVVFIISSDNNVGISFYEKHGFIKKKINYGYEYYLENSYEFINRKAC